MTYDVFISYSRRDYEEVNSFVALLQNRIPGLKCWFDLTGIESGDEFGDKIVSAIDNSSHVLFMVSESSMESTWTKKEVTYAKNTGKRVIPILLKDSKIKGWFLFEYGTVDSIDSTDSKQIDKLVNNLSKWTNKGIANHHSKNNKENNTTGQYFTIELANQLCKEELYEQAFNIYRTLAERGDPDAQSNLGVCYHNGQGVKQDYIQAVYWYRKAAEQGEPHAQYNLGVCYHNGQGVKQDYIQAVYWYRKAVEQGEPNAQYNLGVCYHNGQGVKQDYTQAVYWYRKAAEQGNENAIKYLAELKKQGFVF